MKTLTTIDKVAYLFLIVIFGLGIYFAKTDLTFFDEVYTREDGLIEFASALFLLASSLLLLFRFFKLFKHKELFWKEISWGQRILNVESSQYFIENNAQGETNLHNLVVGETKINKLIFSQILTAVLVIYLIIAPFLYRMFGWIKNLANKFAVPIVQWHHTIAFLIGTGLLVFITSTRKWEIYEFAFSVIFLLIFLNPFNKEIYRDKR